MCVWRCLGGITMKQKVANICLTPPSAFMYFTEECATELSRGFTSVNFAPFFFDSLSGLLFNVSWAVVVKWRIYNLYSVIKCSCCSPPQHFGSTCCVFNGTNDISVCHFKQLSTWMAAVAVWRSDVLAACYWGVYLSILWEMISLRPLTRRLVGPEWG